MPDSRFPFRRALITSDDTGLVDEEDAPTAVRVSWDDLLASGEATNLGSRPDLTRQERKAYDGQQRMHRDEGYTGDEDPSLTDYELRASRGYRPRPRF